MRTVVSPPFAPLLRAPLPCEASISGSDGEIRLPAFMHCPDHLTIRSAGIEERFDASFEGNGLRFQVQEVHRCLRAGRLESAVMPHAATCALLETTDVIRRQIGVRYQADD